MGSAMILLSPEAFFVLITLLVQFLLLVQLDKRHYMQLRARCVEAASPLKDRQESYTCTVYSWFIVVLRLVQNSLAWNIACCVRAGSSAFQLCNRAYERVSISAF